MQHDIVNIIDNSGAGYPLGQCGMGRLAAVEKMREFLYVGIQGENV